MKYRPEIDGLRAVAILPVILFHAGVPGVGGGFVGVDVFFVISGFLITGILFGMMQERRLSILHFYERRARRILPALVLTCLICLAGALLLFVPDDYKQFSKSLTGVAGFASNFIFARWTDYFAPVAMVKPLLHTWSLAVEEQFYVVFPLMLYGLDRFFAERRHTFTLSLYLVLAVSLALNLGLISSSPERTFYLLHTRAWELMLGAVLMLHLQKIKLSGIVREVMATAGIGLLLFCFLFYSRDTVFPGFAAIVPCVGTMFLLWSTLQGETIIGKALASRALVAVGLISYGLYLYHWPVLVFTRYYLDREAAPLEMAGCLVLIFAVAALSYIYVEKPVRNGKVFRTRASVFWASCAALAVLGVIGWAGVKFDGIPQRFSGAALQYAAGADDRLKEKCRTVAPDRISGDTICHVGVTSRKTPDFILWGDSHAGSLLPAVEAMANKYSVSGWVVSYSGCPALFGTERSDGYVDVSCRMAGEAVYKLIQKHKIKHILLVTRWDMYAQGWEEGSIETSRSPSISFREAEGAAVKGHDAFLPAMLETGRWLNELSAEAWIVKQVPPQLVHVPSALAKAVYFGRDEDALRRPYEDIITRRRPVEDVFSRVAQVYPLRFIDPVKTFCPDKKMCAIAAGGHALYTDNSHLTMYGALWSKEMLAPFFNTLRRN